MRFVDEYRSPEGIARLSAEIVRSSHGRHVKLMEVCGGHTHAIYKHGLQDLLPENVELVHGPGCPVCVIPMGRIDDAIAMARIPGVIFATYGDMMRVPSSTGSLIDAKADGADVRFIYSPLDALTLARKNPDRQVVFFAVGFETTAPSTAATLLRARAEGLTNFSVFCNHVTIIPAIKAILDSPGMDLAGFIGPGHVSTIIGLDPFRFIPRDYGLPIVVSGFEPSDILQSVVMILRQLASGTLRVENQYARVVRDGGNRRAMEMLGQTMRLRPFFEWRGLGFISQSALALRPEFADFDAEVRFTVPNVRVTDPKACQCGEVLKGAIKPWQCKVFGAACTPETPIGSCMVSPEGACAAYYNYGRYSLMRQARTELGERGAATLEPAGHA
ncbi:MAG: hydrogenase formation protein HypD [Gemmatimonadota bacterium]|nr:hydrogenase formation protein HypD [Gemmatimonadota bacterium]